MTCPPYPSPEPCSLCPLRLPLPDDLHDAAVAHLVESLYLFAAAIENRYYGQLRRYYAAHQETTNSTTSRRRQRPPTRTSLMTTCRSDTGPPPRRHRGVSDPPLLLPIAAATMWEIRPSTLRNNPGNRPRIYMGYNTGCATPPPDPAPAGRGSTSVRSSTLPA